MLRLAVVGAAVVVMVVGGVSGGSGTDGIHNSPRPGVKSTTAATL